MEEERPVRCLVACVDADGVPCLFGCRVEVTEEEYDGGEHYDLAREMASEVGYERCDRAVVFDENDLPEEVMDFLWGFYGTGGT